MSDTTHDESRPHVTSLKLLAGVWGSLVVLTWLTVAATYFDLGDYALLVALGIAVVKATVVALFFMHLRWEKPFNAIVFLTAILFLGLFLGGTLIDTTHYQHELIPGYAPAMQQQPQSE